MRILHVITKLDVGGAQSIVAGLVGEQIKSGHSVSVATGVVWEDAAIHSVVEAQIEIIDGFVHQLQPALDWNAVGSLQRVMRRLHVDVVHTHSSKGGLLGRVAARRCGVPSVYTAHGWPFQSGAALSQRAQSFVGEFVGGRLGTEIVCVSEAERQLAERLRIGLAGHRHVVFNGIEDAEPVHRGLRDAANPFKLVTVARLESPKRTDVLIRAMGLLDGRFSLAVVGAGSQLADLRQLAAEMGVTERVSFAGQTTPQPFLAEADAFVLLSDYEGMPVTVLEAMRAGLPVVANRLNGVIESTGTSAGLLTELEPDSVAKVLQQLANDPKRCVAIGDAGRTRWAESFTTQQMADRYEMIYAKAISGHR